MKKSKFGRIDSLFNVSFVLICETPFTHVEKCQLGQSKVVFDNLGEIACGKKLNGVWQAFT
jgi:hypothetical protein